MTPQSLAALLGDFIDSHADRSTRAEVTIKTEIMILRDALLSGKSGYRSYPITIQAIREPDVGTRCSVTVGVTYSSTCPCSAALARQLISQKFQQDYAEADTVSVGAMTEWLLQAEKYLRDATFAAVGRDHYRWLCSGKQFDSWHFLN